MNDLQMKDVPTVGAGTASIHAAGSRIAAYMAIVIVAALAAGYYRLRSDSIFACQAAGYAGGRYLSYCQADNYGDFDHGALWFGLEPEASRSAAGADLLFVGNSRMEYGFSTDYAHEWLSRNSSRYFLLGLAYHPRVMFHRALLRRIEPHPKIMVINLDTFFQENASVPARLVMTDPDAVSRYRRKALWQTVHRSVCAPLPALCGNSYAIFRDPHRGDWVASGRISASEAASVDSKVDPAEIAGEIQSGREFLHELGIDRHCVIFTLVPTVDTPLASSRSIASALGVDLISPEVEDLLTFDGSHLDNASAERWSRAFFEAAGPRIRECLARPVAPQSQARR